MNVIAPSSPNLVRDIENMLHIAPNSDHVGLVVIGVNTGIGEPTGDVTVDQNRVGLHLVIGDPDGEAHRRDVDGTHVVCRMPGCEAPSGSTAP